MRRAYRFTVNANDHWLPSAPFRLQRAKDLEARVADQDPGRAVMDLRYPEAVENEDLAWRPSRAARIGTAEVRGADGLDVSVGARRLKIRGEPGDRVVIRRGALRDRRGNANKNALKFEL